MKCFCGGKTTVVFTGEAPDGGVSRRRQCLDCGALIYTHERVDDAPPVKGRPRKPTEVSEKKPAPAKKKALETELLPKRETALRPKKQVGLDGWKGSRRTVRSIEAPANLRDYDRLPLDDPIFDEDPFRGGIGEGV
jgi:hypothetical protein